MTTVAEHLQRVLSLAGPLPPVRLPLLDCEGLVLAEAVSARLAVPVFDNSAMDGFAVRRDDLATLPAPLRVLGDVPAGSVAPTPVRPGECYRIMTGAPVPEGADQVVPVELTDQAPGDVPLPPHVEVLAVPGRSHIRPAGEDVRPGEPVLEAGVVLGAEALAAAASVGCEALLVHPRPRVAVVATGAELVAPGALPGPGQIPDSNSTMLAVLARQAGAGVVAVERADDQPEALRSVLRRVLPLADLVVTAGGVSVGAHDVMHSLVDEGVDFGQVAMSPGKPQGWGLLREGARQVPLLALPGNPVAGFVGFHEFVGPLLRRLAGRESRAGRLKVRAGEQFSSRPGRRTMVPVALSVADGDVVAHAARAGLGAGSHLVASLHRADALLEIDEQTTELAAGDEVLALPVSGRVAELLLTR